MTDWTVSLNMPTDKQLREEVLKEQSLPLSERLKRAADAETRIGNSFKNCSWMGFEHPSSHHYRQASLLQQAALIALQAEQRRSKKPSVMPAVSERLRDEQ